MHAIRVDFWRGGFFSQFYDYEIRNPMFRDIIFEEWPIVYSETNNALVYYYLFWFLPALLGKFMIQIGMTTELVWFISNVLLYIQMVFYLFLIFMLVLAYTNKGEVVTTRTIAQLAACFAAFGGISIIGFEITELLGINRQTETVLGSILIEHYISNIGVLNNWWVMLGNVFNQMLPGLLCLMVFLVCDRIEIAGYLLGLILLMAPYPAMGICVIMGASYIKKCFLNKRVNIRAIFTEYNLWAIIWACICIMFYFGVPGASIKINKFWTGYANIGLIILAIFAYHFFMWLCYFLCVYKQAENKFLLIFSGICLTLFIFGNFDFNARATMGPYFILFIEVFRHVYEKKKNYSGVIILLAWGIITPILSYNDLAIDTKERGSLRGDRDAFYTLSNADETDIYYIGQYIKSNPEQDLFFSKLCKKWDVIQEYPIIKYGYMEDETRYISQATFFSKEAEQKFCSMITGESLTAFETNYLEDNMDHTINFQKGDIIPREKDFLEPEYAKFMITWNNPTKLIHSDKVTWMLDLMITNIGNQDVLAGNYVSDLFRAGVVVTLYDEAGNVLAYPYTYKYIDKTIFSGESKRMVISAVKPGKGNYYLSFDFFCDDLESGTTCKDYGEHELFPLKVY